MQKPPVQKGFVPQPMGGGGTNKKPMRSVYIVSASLVVLIVAVSGVVFFAGDGNTAVPFNMQTSVINLQAYFIATLRLSRKW